MPLRDYEQWLHGYDNPGSSLSWRLQQVQTWLREDLDDRAQPVRILSVCAGDGRDIIDVLADRSIQTEVQAVLLEAEPRIAERARSRAAAAGLTEVSVHTCDAGNTGVYVGAVPAEIVLLVGVFGNISRSDISQTIAAAPQFCTHGATLIWSRAPNRDDINDRVRVEFGAAGFTELEYVETDRDSGTAVGRMRYDGPTVPLHADRHLFTFIR